MSGAFLLWLLVACSTPQTSALRTSLPANLPAQAELREVVFHPQALHQCGPASLAMLMQNSGVNVAPEALKEYLYLPDKQGSLQLEMLASARRYGLLAYVLRPSLQDVLTEVAGGNAVVVLKNMGLNWFPVWHYAVVVGYDLGREEIILRSGLEPRQLLPFTTFENTWARSKHWAMVALPPGRLPHTATAENYVRSVAALTYTSRATEVWPAYTAAMQRWPESLLVKIAAGNDAYLRGELTLAEHIFLEATQAHADSAAAFNNLAQTLSDQGKREEARVAIRRALEIGGPLEAVVRKTMVEIEQANNETLK